MASDADIARAQILLGSTGRWTDDEVGDAIDAEGGVPAAAVLLLESAATAASFEPGMVKAGSQSITQSNVSAALFKAAQRIRDDYGLAGGAGTVGTLLTTTCRPVLGGISYCDDAACDELCACGDLTGCCSCS